MRWAKKGKFSTTTTEKSTSKKKMTGNISDVRNVALFHPCRSRVGKCAHGRSTDGAGHYNGGTTICILHTRIVRRSVLVRAVAHAFPAWKTFAVRYLSLFLLPHRPRGLWPMTDVFLFPHSSRKYRFRQYSLRTSFIIPPANSRQLLIGQCSQTFFHQLSRKTLFFFECKSFVCLFFGLTFLRNVRP